MAIHAALGLGATKGGAVAVGVSVEDRAPRVLVSTFLATCRDADRLAREPYHIAAELLRARKSKAVVAAAVAEGRQRQDQLAARNLRAIIGKLEEAGCKSVIVALLVNRTSWITDVLEYSLAWQEHAPIAEGLAVRDALRFACNECALGVLELDEKSLPGFAANALGQSSSAIAARLKELGTAAGRPWRKEQKLACLSAWLALTMRRVTPR